jgi:hypothetical protein
MRTLLIVFLWCSTLIAQHPRDSWKLKPFDLEAHLTHTLADAPLSDNERVEISNTLAETEDDRQAIMSFRVGSIPLALDGSQQILVRANGSFCGATGNCSMWIFVRKAGRWRLALGTEGQLLMPRSSSRLGFHDIAIGLHDSAFIEQYAEYRWDGIAYKEVDCYETVHPMEDHQNKTFIRGCR